MKNKLNLFGVIVLAAVIGFGLIGCAEESKDDGKPLFSVSGEFKGAGGGNALFKAATSETISRSARAATLSYELTGELEDGDMLFRLKGAYDPSTGKYIASSASSFARYTINGNTDGATATLAVKQGEEWVSFIVSVTIKEVSVKGGNAQDYAGGLPSWAQGNWHDWYTQDPGNYNLSSFEAWSYFSQWYYEANKSSVWHDNWDSTSIKYTVVEAEQLSDGKYDVIFSYPFYKATDAQKKAALEKFFKEIKVPAEFWNKNFNPWDRETWDGENGKNYDNSVIWYICINEKHTDSQWGAKIINWDTFIKLLPNKDDQDDFWKACTGDDFDAKKGAVEAFLKSKNISNYYYWGWKEPDWNENTDHFQRRYTCWEPSCEDGGMGGWWDKTHYYVKWGNETGIQGDWDKYGDKFSKWSSDDYLITYLRSQNVQPETWYTRVRMWKNDDGFIVQYYKGDNDASNQNSHAAPACDTKSLSKIKKYTFDSEYWDWSYFWNPKRTSPRN